MIMAHNKPQSVYLGSYRRFYCNFFSNGALLAGPFYPKGVIFCFENGTHVTLKSRRIHNFCPTCKVLSSKICLEFLLNDPIDCIANFFQK